MFGLEGILASVVLPAVIDLFKSAGGAAVKKFVGTSVDDQIKLENANIERLKALAQLDNPHGTPSQWVIDLRASFRYIVAAVLVIVGAAVLILGLFTGEKEVSLIGFNLVGMPWGFIFGERMWNGFKGVLAK